MSLVSSWAALAVISLLATITPGPNFAYCVRASLQSRGAGVRTAAGFALGEVFHASYCLLGLGLLISRSAPLLAAMKIVAGLYLLYLGVQGLRARPAKDDAELSQPKGIGVLSGFMTAALNPKAMLFAVSIYTMIISPGHPWWFLLICMATVATIEFCWFALVAMALTTPAVQRRYQAAGHWIDRVCGGVLLGVGVRLIASRS